MDCDWPLGRSHFQTTIAMLLLQSDSWFINLLDDRTFVARFYSTHEPILDSSITVVKNCQGISHIKKDSSDGPDFYNLHHLKQSSPLLKSILLLIAP